MNQIPLFDTPRLTVTEFTRRVRRLLEGDKALQDVWVQGEISNLSRPSSGHVYFTLKDAGAALRCVMWRGDALRLGSLSLRDGLSVEAHGKVTVYEPSGQYQLIVDVLRLAGEGALYAEFLRLKAVLEAEGLFDPSRKRPIPQLPHKIGIVTSPSGAALRDMLNVLRRRLPLAEVMLAPSLVQGEEAPVALVAALQRLNAVFAPDVILLARGGGSIEDLWAFNDERVVRAVACSTAPVISGVGHETDFTLVDFAADLRAPTPTAAAELATPITVEDLSAALATAQRRLDELLSRQVEERRQTLKAVQTTLRFYAPARRMMTEQQRVDDLLRRMARSLEGRLALESAQLTGWQERLQALNPLAVLRRGYAVVSRLQDGKVILRGQDVLPGDNLYVRLHQGELQVEVIRTAE
ncbi:MAG: exodeoxyribonuclease VII large subunit [Anaerolineae bacterium]|nr:MAG: exodeoxyribonuclease VII large subunit [Anaerolineae bacterium]